MRTKPQRPGILIRVATGLMVGVGTCGLLEPLVRPAGIRALALVSSARVSPERLGDLAARVWDANLHVLWLAWVAAAVAVAAELAPGKPRLGAVAIHVVAELALLGSVLLLSVHARLEQGIGLVRAVALLLVFCTALFPIVAVWRNARPSPARVFDATNPAAGPAGNQAPENP